MRNKFLYRDGSKVKLNNEVFQLRGVTFGNNVFENNYDKFEEIPREHHSEEDFRRLKSWNVNCVRFYMNYKTFEDDNTPFIYKQSGWDWIDKNIAWAKKYKIYLILTLTVSQGGQQSIGEGSTLWNSKILQERFIDLWKAIATRYKDEPTIAGFDLLNEPIVPWNIKSWKRLAQKTIDEIRNIDTRHMIIIEPIAGVGLLPWTYSSIKNIFLVDDTNTMYSFHFYHPHNYTHQYAIWTPWRNKEGGIYPDNNASVPFFEKSKMMSNRRNRDYLVSKIEPYVKFGRDNNVPIYCGEFGVTNFCYDRNDAGINRGGLLWIMDVIDIFNKYKIHYTLHAYHEMWFGIYSNKVGLPNESEVNKKLIEIFKNSTR